MEAAVEAGYDDLDFLKEKEFDSIRADPKFQTLMKELPARIAAKKAQRKGK
jgi:hypothetical protein